MMKDQNIINQVILEIVKDKENEYFSAADINRIASLVEKYYRQGYEEATKFQMSLSSIAVDENGKPIKPKMIGDITKGGVYKGYTPVKDNEQ